jgi:glycerophosphoryl diester phosphodiesterase
MRIIGHRGARDIWPENGLAGFRAVRDLGIDGVEFDIHPTTDGRFAVIHDPTLDRTTGGSGPVAARSSTELARISLKNSETDTVPMLDEVIDILAPAGLELHIELKADADGRPYPGMEAAILAFVKKRGLCSQVVLTSFLPEVLARLRGMDSSIRLLASIDRTSAACHGGVDALMTRLDEAGVDLIAVEKALLTEEMPFFTRRVGAERLGAWVVNTPADIDHWLAAPIVQITTDRPDLAAQARRIRRRSAG